jgi:hypothetical protein
VGFCTDGNKPWVFLNGTKFFKPRDSVPWIWFSQQQLSLGVTVKAAEPFLLKTIRLVISFGEYFASLSVGYITSKDRMMSN